MHVRSRPQKPNQTLRHRLELEPQTRKQHDHDGDRASPVRLSIQLLAQIQRRKQTA